MLFRSGFAADVHFLAGQEVIKAVATDPKGIGFGALASGDGVQAVSIKRARSSTPVLPTVDNIAHRIYPISRYVFSYSSPAANTNGTKIYLDWIRSDAGQRIAKDAGFYALPDTLRLSQ